MLKRRRLQIMIDEERHERLLRESRRSGAPVGELVRRAIDDAYPGGEEELAEAGAYLLGLPKPDGHEPDWEDQKHELLDERGPRE